MPCVWDGCWVSSGEFLRVHFDPDLALGHVWFFKKNFLGEPRCTLSVGLNSVWSTYLHDFWKIQIQMIWLRLAVTWSMNIQNFFFFKLIFQVGTTGCSARDRFCKKKKTPAVLIECPETGLWISFHFSSFQFSGKNFTLMNFTTDSLPEPMTRVAWINPKCN